MVEEKIKKKIKIKDGNTELELEKGEVAFGAPDYEEYEKKMKKKKEMQEKEKKGVIPSDGINDTIDVKEDELMSVDEILNEKRQNKEQAILAYFQRINLYRFHKEEHAQFIELFQKIHEHPDAHMPNNPDTGIPFNKALIALKVQELHMALRIETRRIDTAKQKLFQDFGFDDKKLEVVWNEWFGQPEK